MLVSIHLPVSISISKRISKRTNVSKCLCDPGYSGPDDGPCVACAAGTFKAESGADACEDCGVNESAHAAAAVCVACHANSSSLPEPRRRSLPVRPGLLPVGGPVQHVPPRPLQEHHGERALPVLHGQHVPVGARRDDVHVLPRVLAVQHCQPLLGRSQLPVHRGVHADGAEPHHAGVQRVPTGHLPAQPRADDLQALRPQCTSSSLRA